MLHIRSSGKYKLCKLKQGGTAIHLKALPRFGTLTTLNAGECWWACRAPEILIHCWWDWKMVHPLWKIVWWFLTKLEGLPCDLAIILLDIYAKGLKTYVHTKPCTWMFTVVPLINVKTWKQPRYPSVSE